ncbi:unnamed protein product [Cuscuta campestris]|uniref:Uncharacterized protein n=1 Tax=Cuscuta campestris TaxID=132261 RepID=A0A484L340_9ASTE|nr:unnamed protein product [Cuscuta campestris]
MFGGVCRHSATSLVPDTAAAYIFYSLSLLPDGVNTTLYSVLAILFLAIGHASALALGIFIRRRAKSTSHPLDPHIRTPTKIYFIWIYGFCGRYDNCSPNGVEIGEA